MALVVKNRQDAHSIREDSIANGIRKALQVSLSTTKRSQRKSLGIQRDQTQHPLNLLEELISQPVFAFIIPLAGCIDFPLHGFVVGEFHAKRRAAKWAKKSW